MKALIVLGLLLMSQSLFADEAVKSPFTAKEKDLFSVIHSNDLAQLMADKTNSTFVFDANNLETRKKEGVIAGAGILTSFDKYNESKELPPSKDAHLVFYCANTQCMASHAAANRAVKAGYKNVSVMADGIQGWKKTGHPTVHI